MLSLGTELFLAFSIASKRVGLPAGSPPPIFAATSMFLISLANILPRRASMTAFLCLVVAHFEWPDMGCFPLRLYVVSVRRCAGDHEVEEQAVDPVVAPVHLGVEGRRQQRTLPDRHDPTGGRPGLHACEHLDPPADLLHPRCADEDRVHRVGQPGEGEIALEGVDLAAEGVAAHGDVESAEGLLVARAVLDAVGEHDHPGTRPEDWEALLDPLPDRLEEVEGAGQLRHGRRLAAGDHQAVACLELGDPSYADRPGAEVGEDAQVLADVTLQREDPDRGRGAHGRTTATASTSTS